MAQKSQLEIETEWITPAGIEGVRYCYGDLVEVIVAKKTQVGVIIALPCLEPEPVFVIELRNGKSIPAKQSELPPALGNTGRKLIIRPYPMKPGS